MAKPITDKGRLDYLQKLTDQNYYTGQVVLRMSVTGRGWRLHETSDANAFSSVRDAIDNFIEKEKREVPI